MDDQVFDVQGARKAGYSDDEILSHLTQSRKFDIDGALKSGYSKQDLINHLSGSPAPAEIPLGQQPASFGGVASTMAGQAGRALGAAWENFDPVQTAKALLPWNARDTAGKLLGATTDAVGRTREALNNKNYKEAGLSALGAIPLVGPPVEQVSRDVAAGNFPEAIGHVGGIAAMGELPRMIPPIVRGVPAAAAATKAAAKAGGGDIAAGTLKTGAGIGLAKSGMVGELADALMGAPLMTGGIKQVGKGVRSAYQAAKESLNPTPPDAIPPPPSAAAPEASASVLDDLAVSLGGKKFSKLGAEGQQTVRDIASRLEPPPGNVVPIEEGRVTRENGRLAKVDAMREQVNWKPPQSPVNTSQVATMPPPPGTIPFKGHDAQMTDLIRQFHAQWPKGTSLRDISSDVFGTKGAVPNYEQALKIHEYMLKNNGKIPGKGDL